MRDERYVIQHSRRFGILVFWYGTLYLNSTEQIMQPAFVNLEECVTPENIALSILAKLKQLKLPRGRSTHRFYTYIANY